MWLREQFFKRLQPNISVSRSIKASQGKTTGWRDLKWNDRIPDFKDICPGNRNS